jgi:hypothetical protein
MSENRAETEKKAREGRPWKGRALALVLGVPAAAYGAYSLWAGRTWLPGLRGTQGLVTGRHGLVLSLVYLLGGLYLLVRFHAEPRCRTEAGRLQLYVVENVLLAGLIAALVYVLLSVGTAG